MMTAFKKANIAGTMYEVISYEDYLNNTDMYQSIPSAIDNKDGYIYPYRQNPKDSRPGFIDLGPAIVMNYPMGTDCSIYSDRNVIDFSNTASRRDIIETQSKLAASERAILTTIDNLFIPPKLDTDTPEMRALKDSIESKQIDLDKYEGRLGANFNNDKRLLKKDRITFDKLRNICRALDIKVSLTFENKDETVPNPMKEKFNVCITDGFDDEDEEETQEVE